MDNLKENQDSNIFQDKSYDFVRQLVQSQNKIYAFILTLVPNWTEADDILQDTVEILWRKYRESKDLENFTTLGIGIAKNLVYTYYRKKKKQECFLEQDALESIASYSEEISTQSEDRVRILRKCLGKLSERDKELIRLRYEEGMKIKNVAEISNRSVAALYKALGRVHDAIMKCVKSGLLREDCL